MYIIKNCPQCGIGEGIYASYHIIGGFRLQICYHCGFQVKNYWAKGDDSEKDHDPKPGFGLRFVTYGTSLDSEKSRRTYFQLGTNYKKVVALFDRLVSRGVIIPEKSFVTKADGSNVEFLRGDIQNIVNTFEDDYNAWISMAKSGGETTDAVG